jgi:AcrR family transcriptional regulator
VTHRRSSDARKQPHQERSRATLDAIVIAATRILEREGLERLTTTRIAEVAGVSVGSLYQYFPNREAIIGAIIDQQLDGMLSAFRGLVAHVDELELEPMITAVLRGLLAVSRTHARLHAPLYEEMGAAHRTQRHARTLAAYVDMVASVLGSRADVAVDDLHAAATLIVHAGDGVIRSLVASNDAAAANVLVTEGVRMICRYLAPWEMRSATA